MKAAWLIFVLGCGPAVGDIADPLYEMARLSCGNAEELVLASSRTVEQKEDMIGQIRARCDVVIRAFELLAGHEDQESEGGQEPKPEPQPANDSDMDAGVTDAAPESSDSEPGEMG